MENRKLIKEILASFVAFIFMFGFFSFLVGADAWDYLWAVIPFFVLMFVRKRVTNFYTFLAIHLIFVGWVVWAFWGNEFFWPIAVIFGFFVVYSFARRLDIEVSVNFGTGFSLVLALGSLAFIADFFGVSDIRILTNLYILLFIAGVLAVICHVQMNNMDKQLRLIDDKERLTSKALFKANYVTMGVFLGVVLAFALIAIFVPSDQIIFLPGLIFAGFYWVAHWVLYPFGLLLAIFTPGQEPFRDEPDGVFQVYLNGETIYFQIEDFAADQVLDDGSLETLGNAASYVTFVLIGMGIVAALVLLFRAMLIRKGIIKRKVPSDVEVEKLEMNLKGTVGSVFSRMGERLRNPIRREYRKKVNSHIKKGAKVKKFHHTKNISDIIRNEENIDEITKQYEAARYGRQ
ncbi:MAG: hypothetical protein FWE44_03330 [Defluviitaleaceae bacterium]|nr:hypothetical protein [Defluviitaleaceae bacterium]